MTEKHNLLANRQFGIRAARTTQDAVAKLIALIKEAIDKNISLHTSYEEIVGRDLQSHEDLHRRKTSIFQNWKC
ncbi:hypothetical protein WA026_023839 [Henosepilachna vigintioctopunctata]|uniref:Uncharacterized protein n=1 Tax=Henosepilachna vigintioctopunctata TaxID=420089 RepID=A0AAW1VJM1_9CUCU